MRANAYRAGRSVGIDGLAGSGLEIIAPESNDEIIRFDLVGALICASGPEWITAALCRGGTFTT